MKLFLFASLLVLSGCSFSMPGKSFRGDLPALTPSQEELAKKLEDDVRELSVGHGERNIFHLEGLRASEDYIIKRLQGSGYEVKFQEYETNGTLVRNIEVEIPGEARASEIFLIGAHYDGVKGSPAANDNGSGVAATLALAEAMKGQRYPRTIRFVFFVNEEPPFFWTEDMGSLRYARRSKERGENIVAMWSLETLGFYAEEEGSQDYPAILSLFYPSKGNFIGFVGMSSARDLVKCSLRRFREQVSFPSEGAALPWIIPHVGSSDHWSFWKVGFPAVMVSDTAMYRYHYYHTTEDLPKQLNYPAFSRVVLGLIPVAQDLARIDSVNTCEITEHY